jgi:hypothetical protein
MITRLLRLRIKKASIEAVKYDKHVKICDTFQDLVELYPSDGPPLCVQNPKLKVIKTARYKKMMKELEANYLKHKDNGDDYDPYADVEEGEMM